MRLFLDLIKSGIVFFVLISGAIGYALSFPSYNDWNWFHFLMTLSTLFFFSAGSFALNQAQESKIDSRMPRTEGRPIPAGKISVAQAYILGFGFLVIGIFSAAFVNERVLALSLFTVVFYNVLYTLYWKRKWAFGAVPGALPGALPVMIGYAANSGLLLSPECIYAFLIMFLWQMPHFWALAIRYKNDYALGGIPVLPVAIGTERTLYHIGLYMFAYVGLAIAAPAFTQVHFFYLLVSLPFALKLLWEFFKFSKSGGSNDRWLSFFLWTNFSLIVFLIGPVIDKWHLSLR